MENKITITVLAEDIINNSYYDHRTCPITRALHRAGYKKLFDIGGIGGKFGGEDILILSAYNSSYDALLTKLLQMYNTKNKDKYSEDLQKDLTFLPIEDFTHTINITENDYRTTSLSRSNSN